MKKFITSYIRAAKYVKSLATFKEENAQNQLSQEKDALLENSAIKDILDSFGGKIIDESIKKVSP